MSLLREGDRFLAIFGFTDYFYVGFRGEKSGDAAADDRVIVG